MGEGGGGEIRAKTQTQRNQPIASTPPQTTNQTHRRQQTNNQSINRQITRIVGQIRPDRQCVMFSATFPRSVEALARALLSDPVEVSVGGRSVVNSDITQVVEIRPEGERFLRLLELLGEWYEAGKVLVFVQSQDKCDSLFRDLLRVRGRVCFALLWSCVVGCVVVVLWAVVVAVVVVAVCFDVSSCPVLFFCLLVRTTNHSITTPTISN